VATHFLNLDTALFTENRYDGLMICGINSAGEADDSRPTQDVIGKSFFSDGHFLDVGGNYRRRITKWFELFGHPLAPDAPGPFERSVVQTNWRDDQSPTAGVLSSPAALAQKWDNFAFHVTTLRPKLLMFMGTSLLTALNSPECVALAERLLGKRVEKDPWKNMATANGELGVAVGIQHWEQLPIIALPHPSRQAWSDEYIGSFRSDISPLISAYKDERRFR
jgi:hypothetical protein